MNDTEMIVQIFRAFSDENRVQILKLLRHGEKCGCVLLEDLKISQPTLSHHMKILCDSGIIKYQKNGKWIHYTISEAGVKRAVDVLIHLTEPRTEERKNDCCNGN